MRRGTTSAAVFTEAVRLIITLGTTAAGYAAGRQWSDEVSADVATTVGAMLGAGIGYVAGGVIGRYLDKSLRAAPDRLRGASGPELFAGAFGVALGVFIGSVIALPAVLFLPRISGWTLAGLTVLISGTFGGRLFAARAHDLLSAVGLRAREAAWTRVPAAGGGYLIDTSAAIDGRLLELARAGLITGLIMVPEFVLDEIQAVADSADRSKRRRGRRGLDILDALRDVPGCDVIVDRSSVPEHDDVDAKLLSLAATDGAALITTDSNLSKAAALRGLRVLNPHALGESLQPAWVTGDVLQVALQRPGSEAGQGVGYLDDGTMVVVEGGAELVGETVEVEVSHLLRTSVGRMVFAKRV